MLNNKFFSIKKLLWFIFSVFYICTIQGCWYEDAIDTMFESTTEGRKLGELGVGDIHLHASLEASDAYTVEVLVRLDDGELFGDDYILNDGDTLTACVGSDCKDMEIADRIILLSDEYIAELPFFEEEEYTVTLYKSGVAEGYVSYVKFPENFEITAPDTETVYSDGDTLVVSWSPVSLRERVELTPKIQCILEDGSVSWNSGKEMRDRDRDGHVESSIEEQLQSTIEDESSPPVSCDISIKMTYSDSESVDPRFDGGHINAKVTRKVTVKYLSSS